METKNANRTVKVDWEMNRSSGVAYGAQPNECTSMLQETVNAMLYFVRCMCMGLPQH